MPTVTAELVIKARDEASATLKGVGAATTSITEPTRAAGLSLMDLYAGVRLVEMGARALKGAYDSVITPSIELADKTRALQNSIGATAEEAGKLIYAADQADVSFATLSTGLKAAIRTLQSTKSEGIAPTIEGLSILADKYNAIADPIERTTFLMHNFGRSGADLATLMLLGGDGIRKLGEEAVTTGAILDQKGVTSLHNLDDATKKLNASILGLKVALAEEASPILTNVIGAYSDTMTVQQRYNQVVRDGALSLQQKAQIQLADMFGLKAWGLEALKAAEATDKANRATKDESESIAARTAAVKKDITVFNDFHGEYDKMMPVIKGTTSAINDQTAALNLQYGLMGKLTAATLYQVAAEGLDDAGKLELARSLGLVNEATVQTIGKLNALKAAHDSGAISTNAYLTQVRFLNDALNGLQSRTVTVDVITHYSHYGDQSNDPGIGGGGGGGGGGGSNGGRHGEGSGMASGANFIVPPGFPNDSYPIRVQSGEHVKVTPAGKGGDATLTALLTNLPGMIARAVRDGMQR